MKDKPHSAATVLHDRFEEHMDNKNNKIVYHVNEIQNILSETNPTPENNPNTWFFYMGENDSVVMRYNSALMKYEYFTVHIETGDAYEYRQRNTSYGNECVPADNDQVAKHIIAVAKLKKYKAGDRIKPCYDTTYTDDWVISEDKNPGSNPYRYYDKVDFLGTADALYLNNTCIYSNGVWTEKVGEQDEMWRDVINNSVVWDIKINTADAIEYFKKRYKLTPIEQ